MLDKYILDTIYLMDSDWQNPINEVPASESDSIVIALQYFHGQLLASVLGFIGFLQISRTVFNKYCRRRFLKKSQKLKERSTQTKYKKDERDASVLEEGVQSHRNKEGKPKMQPSTPLIDLFQGKANTTKSQNCMEPVISKPTHSKEPCDGDHTTGGAVDGGIMNLNSTDKPRKSRKDVSPNNASVDQYHDSSIASASCSQGKTKQVVFSLSAEEPDRAGCSSFQLQSQHCIPRESSPIYIDRFNAVTCLKTSQNKSAALRTISMKASKETDGRRNTFSKSNQKVLTWGRSVSDSFISDGYPMGKYTLGSEKKEPGGKHTVMRNTESDPSLIGFRTFHKHHEINMVPQLPAFCTSPPRPMEKSKLVNALPDAQTKIKAAMRYDAHLLQSSKNIFFPMKPKSHVQTRSEGSPIMSVNFHGLDFGATWQKDEIRDSCTDEESDFASSCEICQKDRLLEHDVLSTTKNSALLSPSPNFPRDKASSTYVYHADVLKMATDRLQQSPDKQSTGRAEPISNPLQKKYANALSANINKKSQGKETTMPRHLTVKNQNAPLFEESGNRTSTQIRCAIEECTDLQNKLAGVKSNKMDRDMKRPVQQGNGISLQEKQRTLIIDSKSKHVNSITAREGQTKHKSTRPNSTTIRSPHMTSLIPVPITKRIHPKHTAEKAHEPNMGINKRKYEDIDRVKHDKTEKAKNNTKETANDVNAAFNYLQGTQEKLSQIQKISDHKNFYGRYDKKEAIPKTFSDLKDIEPLPHGTACFPKTTKHHESFNNKKTIKPTSPIRKDSYLQQRIKKCCQPCTRIRGDHIETIDDEGLSIKYITVLENSESSPSENKLGTGNQMFDRMSQGVWVPDQELAISTNKHTSQLIDNEMEACHFDYRQQIKHPSIAPQEDSDCPRLRQVMAKPFHLISTKTKEAHDFVNDQESKQSKQMPRLLKHKVGQVPKSEPETLISKPMDKSHAEGGQTAFPINHKDIQLFPTENPQQRSTNERNTSLSPDHDTGDDGSTNNNLAATVHQHFDHMHQQMLADANASPNTQHNEEKYEKNQCLKDEEDVSVLKNETLQRGCSDMYGSILEDLASVERLNPEEAEQFYLPQRVPDLVEMISETSSGERITVQPQTKENLLISNNCGNNETGNATKTREIRTFHPNRPKISLRHKTPSGSKAIKSQGKSRKETHRSNNTVDSGNRICEHGDPSDIHEISGPDVADAKRKAYNTSCRDLFDFCPEFKQQTFYETPNLSGVFSDKSSLEGWSTTNIPFKNNSRLHREKIKKGGFASDHAADIKYGHEMVGKRTGLPHKGNEIIVENNNLNSHAYRQPLVHNYKTNEYPAKSSDEGPTSKKEETPSDSISLNLNHGQNSDLNQMSFEGTSSNSTTISWIIDHEDSVSTVSGTSPKYDNMRNLACNPFQTLGHIPKNETSPTRKTQIPACLGNKKLIPPKWNNLPSMPITNNDNDVDMDVSKPCLRLSGPKGNRNIMSLAMIQVRNPSREENPFTDPLTEEQKTFEHFDILTREKGRSSRYVPPKLFDFVESEILESKRKELCMGENYHEPGGLDQLKPMEVMRNNNNIPTSFTSKTVVTDMATNHQTRTESDPPSNTNSESCYDNTSNDVSSGEFGSSVCEAESMKVHSSSSDTGETGDQSKNKQILFDWYKPSCQTAATTTPMGTTSECEEIVGQQQTGRLVELNNTGNASTRSNQGMFCSSSFNKNGTNSLEEGTCCYNAGVAQLYSDEDTDTTNPTSLYGDRNKNVIYPEEILDRSINNRHETKFYYCGNNDDDNYCDCHRTPESSRDADSWTGTSGTSDNKL